MFGLQYHCVEVGVGQSQTKFDLIWIGQILVRFEFGPSPFHDEFAPIRSGHLFGAPQQLPIQPQGLSSRGRRRHDGDEATSSGWKERAGSLVIVCLFVDDKMLLLWLWEGCGGGIIRTLQYFKFRDFSFKKKT